jgi:ribosomal protein S18 acetylase RimI-like enzyme
MVLECNEENLPARRLYERQGFVIRRRLLGFSATSVVPSHQDELTEISIYDAAMAVARA